MIYKIKFNKDVSCLGFSDIFDNEPNYSFYYENEYLKLNPNLHKEDAESKFQVVKKVLRHLTPLQNIRTIVDIGCGNCIVLIKIIEYLSREHVNVSALGIDISSQILLKSKKHPDLIKLRANCENIPLEDRSISLVICIDIMEHVNNPNIFLKEVSRISQYAIFKIPLELSLYTVIKGNKQRLIKLEKKYGHLHHFNRKSVLNCITNNFDIIYENYEKIPNRSFLVDKVQNILIRFNLNRIFAFLFGGFIILLVKSKPRNGV